MNELRSFSQAPPPQLPCFSWCWLSGAHGSSSCLCSKGAVQPVWKVSGLAVLAPAKWDLHLTGEKGNKFLDAKQLAPLYLRCIIPRSYPGTHSVTSMFALHTALLSFIIKAYNNWSVRQWYTMECRQLAYACSVMNFFLSSFHYIYCYIVYYCFCHSLHCPSSELWLIDWGSTPEAEYDPVVALLITVMEQSNNTVYFNFAKKVVLLSSKKRIAISVHFLMPCLPLLVDCFRQLQWTGQQ